MIKCSLKFNLSSPEFQIVNTNVGKLSIVYLLSIFNINGSYLINNPKLLNNKINNFFKKESSQRGRIVFCQPNNVTLLPLTEDDAATL